MPTWLFTAIWIIMLFWSALEICAVYAVSAKNAARRRIGLPQVQYTTIASVVTVLWFISLVLLICYSAFG